MTSTISVRRSTTPAKKNEGAGNNDVANLLRLGMIVRPAATTTSATSLFAVGGGGRRRNNNDEDEDEKGYLTDSFVPETSFGSEAVPQEQLPINEYLDVIRQPLFDWASLPTGSRGLLTRLALVYGAEFVLVCYPIAGATFTQPGYEVQKIASANLGAVCLLFLLLVRLYSGWGYVASRLTSRTIEYEETGWYDGNVESKTPAELKRDQFLYQSQVQPVVERLKQFLMGMTGICVASFLALQVANSQKPLFNEYDPDILERLRYDDKLADKAAVNSAGKPTYCD